MRGPSRTITSGATLPAVLAGTSGLPADDDAVDNPPDAPADIPSESSPSEPSPARWRDRLREPWAAARLTGLAAYLLSRAFVLAGAAAVATQRVVDLRPKDPTGVLTPLDGNAGKGMLDVLLDWDSAWYLRIVRMGYPRHVVPHVKFEVLDARAAFFPVYPFLVRGLNNVLPGGDTWVSLGLNVFAGFAFVYLVGLLTRRLFDVESARRAMVLTAMFPGSFVLLYAYSEAVMLLFSALCLWLLHEKRWWAAGLAAAVVTASRPNGVAAAVACAVAALFAIKNDREWKALIAPILAPVGWLSFQVLLSLHAHERGVWFRVQTEAWGEGLSFGMTALRRIGSAIVDPLGSPGSMLTLFSVAAMIGLLYGSWKIKLPPAWWAYSATILALMLLPATVTARPRFLYTAFPIFIGFAAWWPRRYRDSWAFLMAVCGAGLVAVTAIYGARGAIP